MKNQKEVKISFWAAQATTIVSVTLVLLIIGIIAMTTFAAQRETRRLREKVELTMILADSVSNARAASLLNQVKALPAARTASLITKEQALAQWKADTGEDLEQLFGVNPLSPEITVGLNAAYANPDSITIAAKRFAAIPGVEEVAAPDATMARAMNDNISTVAVVLGIFALVMLVISFVLINNTVHLTIYARRFTIHTMQLVGATDRFIRLPVVVQNLLAGLLAGLLASGIIALALLFAPKAGLDDPARYIGWPAYGVIAGALTIFGALICALAASIATRRYLRRDYDKLFK